MTAKRQLAIFLSIALAASVSHAQSTISEFELSLDPPTPTAKAPGSVDVESVVENTPKSQRALIPAKTISHPTKIERSILDSPKMKSVPVVSPTAQSMEGPKALLTGHGSLSLNDDDVELVKPNPIAGSVELIRQRFPNGKPQIERWVAEDAEGNIVNHGKYVEYDASGATIASGNYAFGQRDGVWTKQLTNEQTQQLIGQVEKGFTAPFTSRASFKQGQLDGEWTVSDARGNPLAIWSYASGVRRGSSSLFNSKGEVTQFITYQSNMADGPARVTAQGQAIKDTNFSDGMMLRQVDKWYPAVAGKQRVLQAQEWHLVPAPFNVAASDWDNNRIEYRSVATAEPIRHGLSVTFYPNGQRESEGNYERGQRSGTFAWWYVNGQQKTVGEYQNNVEQNEWTWWHENGMKQASGTFVEGRKTNEWSLWSPEGKLVKRALAEDGTQVADRDTDTKPPKNRY